MARCLLGTRPYFSLIGVRELLGPEKASFSAIYAASSLLIILPLTFLYLERSKELRRIRLRAPTPIFAPPTFARRAKAPDSCPLPNEPEGSVDAG